MTIKHRRRVEKNADVPIRKSFAPFCNESRQSEELMQGWRDEDNLRLWWTGQLNSSDSHQTSASLWTL